MKGKEGWSDGVQLREPALTEYLGLVPSTHVVVATI